MNPHSSITHHGGIRLCRFTLILFLVTLAGSARAGVVTLTAHGSVETNGVAELTVGPYEIAQLISFPRSINGPNRGKLEIIKDGMTFLYQVPGWRDDSGATDLDPVIVAGPATIRLRAGSSAICTIRITPEAYPPDRAVLIPPGTNAARVTMECSTNLVNWFTATNGVYGPLPEAKFFRITGAPVP